MTSAADLIHLADARDERMAIQAEPTTVVREKDPLMAKLAELVSFVPLEQFEKPPTAADCLIPALGIVHGPPNTFIGASFVGKTLVSMSGALDVATGRLFWGVWECKRAKVLHLDHEQGRHATIERFVRLCRARGIEPRDVVGTWWESAIYPALHLKQKKALDLYCRLFDGFGFVLVDALKGLTPGVEENSSEIADFLGILRMASEKTRCAVWLLHHAGKTSADGPRPRAEMGRGSSAIKDQSQTWMVATGEKYKPVHVSHEKTRAAKRTVDDFQLRLVDVPVGADPMGGLRVVHEELEQGGANPSIEKAKTRIVEFFRKHAGIVRASRRDLRSLVGGRAADFERAFSELLLAERVGKGEGCFTLQNDG